ncbi:DUF5677 domain-containing protein [Thalassospira xiamenensis]|uniref:Uncharacterized protein n=1 Tax=Thalassospira xiamenensis TaxID=220697 RepID=A0A367XIF5_9PROT|nr:DUF5677 domain-containing protein [Thalassospira xiamenensis]KZB52708.1 hypothetical protein AUP41_05235 [Thalassospira xiamenensis]RCK53426.1 hypothetical protein TH44_04410 [Thalassospira xiamenensis]
MSKLNKVIEDEFKKIPEIFLKKLIEEKLDAQGIHDPNLTEAISVQILSGKDVDIDWDSNGSVNIENLELEITAEDTEKLSSDIKAYIKNEVPKIVRSTTEEGAKILFKSLENIWSDIKENEKSETQQFQERLELRWGKALDPLRMLLTTAREVGQEYTDKINKQRANTPLSKQKATIALHMRACQTTTEILTLLENGLADGAYARWRTLYELTVVALFIDKFGNNTAERYLEHGIVSHHEFIINELRFNGITYDPTKPQREFREIERQFRKAIATYGKPFETPYGWAAEALELRKPNFQDLERAIDWEKLPPDYKLSSYKVHAGTAGTMWTLGSQVFLHAGASNAGLEIPATRAAHSLALITSLLFENLTDLEEQIALRSLLMMRDKVNIECNKAARRLERDKAKFYRLPHR